MAVEKGTDSQREPNQNDLTKQLQLQIELMQKQLEELRNQKRPQEVSAPAGFSVENINKIVEAAIRASNDKPDKQKLTVKTFVEERDIDKDDFDEKGVLFCAYSTGYLIVDDVRQGFPVSTPFGNAIFFKFEGSTKTRDSRGKVVLNTFCSYLSRSKKEQEWLRGHRYFGIKFFESAKEALSTDADKAQKLSRYIDAIMSLDQHQVVLQCQQYHVPISGDMRAMRILLASKMLKKAEETEKTSTQRAIADLDEEKLFLAGNKTSAQR